MYGFAYFLHIAGLAVWLGSLIGLGMLLQFIAKNQDMDKTNRLANHIVRLVNRLMHPSAFLVLLSGGYMLFELGYGRDHPFWLIFMERFGSIVILLSIILISIQGSKIKKVINGEKLKKKITLSQALSRYNLMVWLSVVLVLIVTLVVSLKIV